MVTGKADHDTNTERQEERFMGFLKIVLGRAQDCGNVDVYKQVKHDFVRKYQDPPSKAASTYLGRDIGDDEVLRFIPCHISAG
jgi:hypothetical protein